MKKFKLFCSLIIISILLLGYQNSNTYKEKQEDILEISEKDHPIEIQKLMVQVGEKLIYINPLEPIPYISLQENETLKISNLDDYNKLEIYDNENLVYGDTTQDGKLYLMNDENKYLYQIRKTNNNEDTKDTENLTYSFYVQRDLLPTATLNVNELYPGDLFIVTIDYVNTEESISLVTPLTEYPVNFFKNKNSLNAYITVPSLQKEGNVDLEIQVKKDSDIIHSIPLSLNILQKTFETDYLYVDETLSSMRNDDASAIMQKHIDEARANPSQELYIDGPFIQPVEGRITTEYGQMRYVNDKLTSRHNGIDIAANRDTPINADQNGKIVLAMELPITGNTIIIDHGQNIYSAFYHLNGFNVEKNQIVNIGDVIGFVGTTGFSTGNHLHWCIWVNGDFTNPWELINKESKTSAYFNMVSKK